MPAEPTVVDIDEDLANRLRDAQQAYDEVAEYLQDIKDEVKHRYADYENVIGFHGDEQIFTCVRRTSTRIDGTKLKRDWPDLWQSYSTTSTSTYLSIKRERVEQ